MIHLIDEGWKEMKMVSISAVEHTTDEETGERKVELTHHSYRAGVWDAATFANHHWAEACRRGVDHAKTVACISDGAAWIWAIVTMCFAMPVQILNWWHAVQRLWTIARATRTLFPRGTPLPEPVRQAIGYIFHNRRRMDYASFRQQGYPIGSGTIESGCKTVVQSRMKQSGMRWSRSGAQAMLVLRCLLLSDRWDELGALHQPT